MDLPHRRAIRASLERLIDVDRFVRLHYFGFTAMLVLLGAASVEPDPHPWLLGGLLLVGVCFHVHGYVLNDVIDLEVDRSQPLRRKDPLVRGAVSREAALAFALVQIPLAALVSFHLDAGYRAWLALGAAFGLSIVYDKWGKACRVPPVTDLVQGLAWGSLALYAALVASPSADLFAIRERALPLLAFGVGYILLINGVHGGLRDLGNDLAHERRTTAIFLGARPTGTGATAPAMSSWGVVVFAFVVHVAMFLPSFEHLMRNAVHYEPPWHALTWALMSGHFVASSWVLWRVVKPWEPTRHSWISAHIFVLLMAPLVLYLPSNLPNSAFKSLVLVSIFVPLILQVGVLERVMGLIARGESRARDCDLPSRATSPDRNRSDSSSSGCRVETS